jgi:hypothetical protein
MGRVQQENALNYSYVIREANLSGGITRPSPRRSQTRVLERFEGFVVKVEGEWAHVTLTTEKGEEFAGAYPAAELAAKGVRERDRFLLATVDRGDAVHFEINLIARREVSSARQQAIREKIACELGDYAPSDDY